MTEKVLNNNLDLSEKFESRNSIAAIDWGLGCANRYKKTLLFYSLIPATIEATVAYVSYSRTLNAQQLFLAFVFTALATSWLVTSAAMLAFQYARDKELLPQQVALRALSNMPKVLLSYLGLLAILLISFYIQPLLLILVFMIWSPMFCIAEVYTWIDKPVPERDEDYSFFNNEEEEERERD